MFDPTFILGELTRNRAVIAGLLEGCPPELYKWKPSDKEWSLLEVACHLVDVERDDFRQRVKLVLEDPTQTLPPFDPVGLVTTRDYINQNYETETQAFLMERDASIQWLHSLQSPLWENTYQHSTRGAMSAGLFFTNWLAHDQLHIRQINRVKRQFLQKQTGMDLSYAGNW